MQRSPAQLGVRAAKYAQWRAELPPIAHFPTQHSLGGRVAVAGAIRQQIRGTETEFLDDERAPGAVRESCGESSWIACRSG